jgi:hypothetical protein
MKEAKTFGKIISVIFALLLVPIMALADIYWESQQTVEGGNGSPPRAKTIRNYFTPTYSRMDIGENVMIADFNTMTGYVLDTSIKQYLVMKMNAVGKIPEGLKEEIQVTPTDETRTIAGYKCRKYMVSYMKRAYEEWLSKEVEGYQELKAINDKLSGVVHDNPLFQMGIVGKMDKLDGFPVQTVMPMDGGRKRIVTLSRVSQKPISPSVFTVPDGYKTPGADAPPLKDSPAPANGNGK